MRKTLPPRIFLVRLMQITSVYLFISVLVSSLAMARTGRGQDALLQNVSVQIENKPLKTALSVLEKAASVKFGYMPTLIQSMKRVSVSASNEQLGRVLDRLLKPQGLTYQASGEYIILTKVSLTPRPAPRRTDHFRNKRGGHSWAGDGCG